MVPETILKRRKAREELKAKSILNTLLRRKALKSKNATIFKRAESYVKEYRARERAIIRLKRQAREKGNFYVEPEAKLAFVVRIRGYIFLIYLSYRNSNDSILISIVSMVYHRNQEKFFNYFA